MTASLAGSDFATNPNFTAPSLKAYVFINAMLRPIQQGIQGGHALVEMAAKYHSFKGNPNEARVFWDWAERDKTVAFCSAGFHAGIQSWEKFIFNNHHGFPRCKFREDDETLAGLVTAVAIIVPGFIYETANLLRKGELQIVSDTFTTKWVPPIALTPFQYELVERIAGAKLAS